MPQWFYKPFALHSGLLLPVNNAGSHTVQSNQLLPFELNSAVPLPCRLLLYKYELQVYMPVGRLLYISRADPKDELCSE